MIEPELRARRVTSAVAAVMAVAIGGAGPTGAAPSQCVAKSGAATGITRDFAEYEALLIIKQVTGNWPIESDRIVGATYACKPDGAMWRCIARAKVCKG